ncbi:MAG: PA2779 family protein [Desulfobacterales bacterium]|nr:MAG: PA2779 family protein [Desulfobacterales bacterium]
MKVIRRWVKPTSIALTILMLLISVPFQSVLAAMIGTETVMDSARGQEARAYLQQLLAREDVQAALIAHGIDPMEAKSRIDALSDDEVIRIADQIDQLPSGGTSFLGFLLVVTLVLFLVLVILDLTGVTDVFPFIKSQR